MKISELQVGQGKIDIQAEVVEIGQIREFEKFGKSGRVCNAKIKDDSGDISLTIWNEQIDQIKVGCKVKISNGYVSEFRGDKQLSTGKFGTLEVLEGKSEDHGEHVLTKDEVEEAEALNEELPTPETEEEVTEDEMEESELVSKKAVAESDDSLDVDEEKID